AVLGVRPSTNCHSPKTSLSPLTSILISCCDAGERTRLVCWRSHLRDRELLFALWTSRLHPIITVAETNRHFPRTRFTTSPFDAHDTNAPRRDSQFRSS